MNLTLPAAWHRCGHFSLIFLFCFFLSACDFELAGSTPSGDPEQVQNIGGNPSAGSRAIYASADLKNLCVDSFICEAPYEKIPASFRNTGNAALSDTSICDFDSDPNVDSTFLLRRVNGSVNGLRLLLSKEDLFFLAWVSMRYQINPYFLLGILSAESRGNCAAVSGSHAEGCFQITNTFGQGQLDDSYPERMADWFWTNRSGTYYPDDIFIDELVYFGESPSSEQFRITLDPNEYIINDEPISSVVNFHFGVIASGLYFHWQQYLLYHHYDEAQDSAEELFAMGDGKALWQAAAYNGGAYGAANAIIDSDDVADFLDERSAQTQQYAPLVADYCHSYQAGTLSYDASYTQNEVHFLIDLLRQTYPDDSGIDWEALSDDVDQVFFADGTTQLSFVDDIKALVYVISTFDPALAPEWPSEDSL